MPPLDRPAAREKAGAQVLVVRPSLSHCLAAICASLAHPHVLVGQIDRQVCEEGSACRHVQENTFTFVNVDHSSLECPFMSVE